MIPLSCRREPARMTDGAIFPQLIAFAWPMILAGVLQRFYNMADAIAAGQYLESGAVGALGITNSLTDLILKLFIGLSVGAGAVLARYYGAGNMGLAKSTVHSSVMLALVSGVAIGIAGCLLARPMLVAIDTPAELLEDAAAYLRTYLLGAPALLLFNFISAIFRAMGDSRKPLWVLGISGAVNIMLNYLAAKVWHLGVFGIGMATAIAQYLSAGILIILLARTQGACKLQLSQLRIEKQALRSILIMGLPAGIQSIAFSLSNVLIQTAVNGFGSTAVEGNAAAANLGDFMDIATSGIYHTALIFMSQNYGAHQGKRIRKGAGLCILLSMACSIGLGTLCLMFHRPLLGLYTTEAAAMETGLLRLRMMCLPHVFCGIMDAASGSLRGLGRSMAPMCTSMLCVCVLRVIWLYTAFVQSPTPATLYISYPITWAIAALANILCLCIAIRKCQAQWNDNQ